MSHVYINEEFVSFEIAQGMKDLGFEESCLRGYTYRKWDNKWILRTPASSDIYKTQKEVVLAPLKQQAFRWFRKKYGMYHEILTDCTTSPKFVYEINEFVGNPKDLREKEWYWKPTILSEYLYLSYEEAELFCLNELIKIVK